MKIVKAGYEILTPLNGAEILKHIERIGRVCYKSEDKITEESAPKFVAMLIKRGHQAMIEHYSFSVRFIVDRGVSHEIVRHRMASFAQESTRYCNYNNKDGGCTFIQPFWIKADLSSVAIDMACDYMHNEFEFFFNSGTTLSAPAKQWLRNMAFADESYKELVNTDGWQSQQARSVLPNSLKTEVIMTANLREWRHFFKLRTADTAHPQMREVTVPLLKELKQLVPIVFDDI
jgi:thymidylate synthase (FAD)